MKPVYRHSDGTFAPPVYLTPGRFLIVEGLLGYHTDALRDCFDIRVFLDPPESLRRRWKVVRDCSRRGYTTNQVLDELDRRERRLRRSTSALSDTTPTWSCGSPTRPAPSDDPDATHLDAHLLLRPGLPHPDLSDVVGDDPEQGLSLVGRRTASRTCGCRGGCRRRRRSSSRSGSGSTCTSPATCGRSGWASSPLGTDLNRSDSLAIVQLLVLYHLVTARAKVAVGGGGAAART